MKSVNQLDLCRSYLRSAAGDLTSTKSAKRQDGPVITISREAGARGNSIAGVLVGMLANMPEIPQHHPWTLFNQNLIQQVIDEHDLPAGTQQYFPEDSAGEFRSMIAEMLGLHPGVFTSVRKTAETIRRIAKAGNAIIVGRGGNLITTDISHSIHVRLVGSEKARIRHYARRFEMTESRAAAEIARLDQARKGYIKAHFAADIEDPTLYDLIINTDRFSNEAAARVIAKALAERAAA
jgi:cytidylate kinase